MSDQGNKKNIGDSYKATRFQPGEDARKRGSHGGIASGRSRRFAKTFKDAALAEMDKKVDTNNGDKVNGREAVIKSLVREAVKGNVRAAELLMKICGEAPIDKVEVSGGMTFGDLLMKTGTVE